MRSRSANKCWVFLLTIMMILSIVSCGEKVRGEEAASSPVVKAENTEIGKSLEGGGWKVTLLDEPVQMKIIGSDAEVDPTELYIGFSHEDPPSDDDIAATGVYIAIPIEIANTTDEPQMVTRSVLKVIDSEGQEYVFAKNITHMLYVGVNERWMSDSHMIVPSVPDAGEVREGPILFDVPEDATGLKLVLEGTDETIDLGFWSRPRH